MPFVTPPMGTVAWANWPKVKGPLADSTSKTTGMVRVSGFMTLPTERRLDVVNTWSESSVVNVARAPSGTLVAVAADICTRSHAVEGFTMVKRGSPALHTAPGAESSVPQLRQR